MSCRARVQPGTSGRHGTRPGSARGRGGGLAALLLGHDGWGRLRVRYQPREDATEFMLASTAGVAGDLRAAARLALGALKPRPGKTW